MARALQNLPTRKQVSAVARHIREGGKSMRLRLVNAARSRRDDDSQEVNRQAPPSKVIRNDLERLVQTGQLLLPPYNPDELCFIRERSGIITTCVDAMVTNIDRQGRIFKTSDEVQPLVDAKTISKDEILRQKMIAADWYNNCNPKMSFEEIKARRTADLHTIGWSGIEVRRDPRTNQPLALNHVPGQLLRATRLSKEPVLMRLWVRDTTTRRWVEKLFHEFVRLYATTRSGRVVWFKEYGDQRSINAFTGKPTGRDRPDYTQADEAHELLWFSAYACGREPYGVPAWIPNAFNVAGVQHADILNLSALMDGRIPRVVLITDMEFDYDIEEYLQEKLEEASRPENKFAPFVIQGLPKEVGIEDAMVGAKASTQSRWEWVKLQDVIPDDAMYTNYTEASDKRVQRSYRLPDILVGRSDEFNRATAFAAIDTAEKQIFAPVRREDDWVFNRRIMPEIEDTWTQEMQSLGPQVVDANDVNKIVTAMTAAGVGNPNAWGRLAERVTGIPFEPRDDVAGQLPMRLLEAMITMGLVDIVEDPDDDSKVKVVLVGAAARDAAGGTPEDADEAARAFAEARAMMVELVRGLRTGEVN